MSLHTHMLLKSCMYCSSPRPPSTSLSSLRRISSSNCREGMKTGLSSEQPLPKHHPKETVPLPAPRPCHSPGAGGSHNIPPHPAPPGQPWLSHPAEAAGEPVLAEHHVEEDGDGGFAQLQLRHQRHLQDGTHHARDKLDLALAWEDREG